MIMKKFSVPQYGQPEHIATDWMTEYGEKIIPIIEPIIRIPLIKPDNLIIYNIIFGLLLAFIGSIRGISKYLPK